MSRMTSKDVERAMANHALLQSEIEKIMEKFKRDLENEILEKFRQIVGWQISEEDE
ncbi:MAG: hypothetical protein M0P69_01650 [Bacteroidales bacterium]|nr:hypothetical protein [Bacteroidales bacterium]